MCPDESHPASTVRWYDRLAKVRGMDVTIVTSARNDEEGRELLRLMQMPFRQR